MTIGPIQMLVGVLDSPEYSGAIYHALEDIREKGIIRLIDALAVGKDDDGQIQKVEMTDFSTDDRIELGSKLGALIGFGAAGEEGLEAGAEAGAEAAAEKSFGASADDILNIANSLPPGKVAIFLLFEHTWAIDLRDAFRSQGGIMLAQGMLTPETLIRAGMEMRQPEE
jgi:uncharacterized membrane protein